jgi:hypothetical protein
MKPNFVREFADIYVKSLHAGGTMVMGQSRAEIKID